MRKSQLSEVKAGAVLARSIYDDRGSRLLAAGAELTPRVIASLTTRGIITLLVDDKLSEDILLQEAVSEQIRMTATGRVYEDKEGGKIVPFDIDLRSTPTLKVMSIAS